MVLYWFNQPRNCTCPLTSKEQRENAQWLSDSMLEVSLRECIDHLYNAHRFLQKDNMWVHSVVAALNGISPYPKTKNGPFFAKWVQECRLNYATTCALGNAIAEEYLYRYKTDAKDKMHIQWLSENIPGPECWEKRVSSTSLNNIIPPPYTGTDYKFMYAIFEGHFRGIFGPVDRNDTSPGSKWKDYERGRAVPDWAVDILRDASKTVTVVMKTHAENCNKFFVEHTEILKKYNLCLKRIHIKKNALLRRRAEELERAREAMFRRRRFPTHP